MAFIKRVVAFLILAGSMAVGQNAFYTGQAFGVNPIHSPSGNSTPVFLSYAQVKVCNYSATNTCAAGVASVTDIFGNPLTIVGGNFGQLQTDVVGRFSFGCGFGIFTLQIAATGSNTPALSYPITCPAGASSPAILSTPNTWTSTNTFNGITTFNAAVNFNGNNPNCPQWNVTVIDFTVVCASAGGPFFISWPAKGGTVAMTSDIPVGGTVTSVFGLTGNVMATITAHRFVGNNTGSTAAPVAAQVTLADTDGSIAGINSPALVTPTATTNPAASDDSLLLATTHMVQGAINAKIGGTLIQAKRTTSTCTTTNSSFDTCDVSLTWPVTFGNTNYTVTCSGVGPVDGSNPTTGRVNLQIASKSATAVVARTVTLGASAINWTEIDCWAIHD